MAATKPTKKRRASSNEPAEVETGLLRLLRDPRYEKRYEPRTPTLAALSVLGMSIGAVLVGAGTYGQWLRAEALGPHPYGPHLLGAGAVVLLLVSLFGRRLPKPVRVGDAGVAIEKDANELDRIAWFDVQRIFLDPDLLIIQASGHSISIPLASHAAAAAQAIAEAKRRIPAKVEDGLADKLPKVGSTASETLPLDAPQVTGLHCRKSERPIAFEGDARLCGSCGETYHKESVPKRCLTCEAKLR